MPQMQNRGGTRVGPRLTENARRERVQECGKNELKRGGCHGLRYIEDAC
jgi:hypothetical protein